MYSLRMKAVILAAGRGTRMPEITKDIPKALVPVCGVPVLERILDSLLAINIRDVVITTGHFAEKIEEFVHSNKKYADLAVTYVFNPKFADTNYIYSMWIARDVLTDDDILLFHGDMVYDQHILEGIAASPVSAACIRKGGELPEKDFKGRVVGDRVMEIGVHVFGEDAYACMPIYKVLQSDMQRWMQEIGTFVVANDLRCYAENALNRITDAVRIVPHYYTVEDLCMEVDNLPDVQEAERRMSA